MYNNNNNNNNNNNKINRNKINSNNNNNNNDNKLDRAPKRKLYERNRISPNRSMKQRHKNDSYQSENIRRNKIANVGYAVTYMKPSIT